MGNESSRRDGNDDGVRTVGTSLGLPLPVRDHGLFKHGAVPYILNFLGDNPGVDVSIRQLSTIVPMSERATREGVDALEANELVDVFHEGNARRVSINSDRLDKPEDPILSVPQTEFHTPIRIARHAIESELEQVVGVVLFGSVARGEADPQSDVDLWVLVEEDRMEQRHAANRLVQDLEDLKIPSTMPLATATGVDFEENWQVIRERLEDSERDWPSARRYAFEFVVETPGSIVGRVDRVDSEKIFGEGITILSSPALDRVKSEVLGDE